MKLLEPKVDMTPEEAIELVRGVNHIISSITSLAVLDEDNKSVLSTECIELYGRIMSTIPKPLVEDAVRNVYGIEKDTP